MNTTKIKNIFIALFLLYGVIAWIISGTGDMLFERLHLELDTANGILSGLFAIFVWPTARLKKGWKLRPYLAIAFAFAAGAEILHALIGIEWHGSFAWIGEASNVLRPATWPPSTYLFPMALILALRAGRKEEPAPPAAFAAQLVVLAMLLYAVFMNVPSFTDTGLLGIHRPFQIPVLALLVGAGYAYWKKRADDPLFEPLVYCIAFLFISDGFMLYSTSPHEKWTMIAHSGKLAAYLLMYISMMKLAKNDFIARSQAEEALRTSEERWRFALEGSGDGIWEWNIHAGKMIISSMGKAMFGFAEDEIGDDMNEWQARVHPGDREHLAEDTLAYFQDKTANFSSEYRLRCKDGSWKWILTRGIAVERAANGHVLRMVGTHTDLTGRKQTEEKLRTSEANLHAILDNFPYLVWLKDTSSRFIAVNQPFIKTTGLEQKEEVLGKTDFDLWPEELAEKYRADDAKVMSTRRKILTEEPSVMENGEMCWVETFKTPIIDENGNLLGTTGFARDITERKQAEENLRRYEQRRLALVNEQKDILVREVHHRIKNSLQGIMGLLRQYAAEHPEAATALDDAVGKIHAIAAIHGLQSRMPSEAVYLVPLMEKIVGASKCPIKLVSDLPHPATLSEDEAVPVALILNELVTNAWKHGHAPERQAACCSITINRLAGDAAGVAVTIANPFDVHARKAGRGSGLDLVKSLLPRQAARLEIAQRGSVFSAVLELSPPIVTFEK